MTINPPRILLNVRPDAHPVEVAQQEYDQTRKRIAVQHKDMTPAELDEHVDYVLCTIARPGKTLEPGSITDPTQAVNAFIADSAVLRDALRGLHSAQVDEIRAVTSGLAEVKESFHGDLELATLRIEQKALDSDLNLTAAARSTCEQLARSSAETAKVVRGAVVTLVTSSADRYRLSARDRWIQTGILAAGLLAVAGAILRGVL